MHHEAKIYVLDIINNYILIVLVIVTYLELHDDGGSHWWSMKIKFIFYCCLVQDCSMDMHVPFFSLSSDKSHLFLVWLTNIAQSSFRLEMEKSSFRVFKRSAAAWVNI